MISILKEARTWVPLIAGTGIGILVRLIPGISDIQQQILTWMAILFAIVVSMCMVVYRLSQRNKQLELENRNLEVTLDRLETKLKKRGIANKQLKTDIDIVSVERDYFMKAYGEWGVFLSTAKLAKPSNTSIDLLIDIFDRQQMTLPQKAKEVHND